MSLQFPAIRWQNPPSKKSLHCSKHLTRKVKDWVRVGNTPLSLVGLEAWTIAAWAIPNEQWHNMNKCPGPRAQSSVTEERHKWGTLRIILRSLEQLTAWSTAHSVDRSEDSEGLQPLQMEQVASGQKQLPVPWTRNKFPSELQPDIDGTRKAHMPCCTML